MRWVSRVSSCSISSRAIAFRSSSASASRISRAPASSVAGVTEPPVCLHDGLEPRDFSCPSLRELGWRSAMDLGLGELGESVGRMAGERVELVVEA